MRTRCWLAAVCLLLVSAAAGATTGDSWFARVWQSDDGLPDDSVHAVAQTPDGFLWITTELGLARFDGARFQKISLSNIATNNSVVSRLFVDRRGQLWMAMNRGAVVCVGTEASRIFTPKDGLPESYPGTFTEDGEGAIWVSYMGEGRAVRIKDGGVRIFGPAEGLPEGRGGLWLATDATGQLYFAKNRNVGVFRGGRFLTLLRLNSSVVLVAPAGRAGVWFTAGSKLFRFQEGSEPEQHGQFPEGADPKALLEDRGGTLWLGTGAHGLFQLDGTDLRSVHTSHRDVFCLAEDREGNLWVGTGGGGLNRLRPRVIELIDANAGLPVESLRSVCKDAAGALWAVTRNSMLLRQEGAGWVNMSALTNWPGGHAFCVAADPSGAVWIGTWGRGLYRFKDGSYTQWRTPDGLLYDWVRSLMTCPNGDLWVGSELPPGAAGLQRFSGNDSWQTFKLPAPARLLRAMAKDNSGNVWVGCGDGHLFRVAGNDVIDETACGKNPPTAIRSLATTTDGSLWIGYAGGGVGWLKGRDYGRITSALGLRDDYISRIVDDERGWLWFGGSGTIFKVARQELTEAAQGRLARVRCVVYGRGEGVPGLQSAFEAYPGALRDSDGRLYVATRMGLAVIHTERMQDNPDLPPVLIGRVIANGRVVAAYDSLASLPQGRLSGVTNLRVPGATLRLPPNHRKLEFELSAPSFTAPENVSFKYRLEQVEDQWVEAGTQRSATYSQLPAGTYRFRVIACNHSGFWNEAGATLSFVVLPFFWQAWWFRGAVLAGFTLSVIAAVRYVSFRRLRQRLRLLEQQSALDKERSRIARDLHDDLGASLTHVTLLLELAMQNRADPGTAGVHVRESIATTQQAIKSLDETVWAVNPRNDTLPELIDYLGQFAVEFLQLAGIRCGLDLPDNPPDWPVSAEVRHNLFLTVKEALNNIVRHAGAREVWFRIHLHGPSLTVLIEDNGRGFDAAPDNGLADGLRNMRDRARAIGGQCEIVSAPGGGTRVSILYSRRNGNGGS